MWMKSNGYAPTALGSISGEMLMLGSIFHLERLPYIVHQDNKASIQMY